MENISERNLFGEEGRIYFCEQCGRCSSACPITGSDGFNIRQLVRRVEVSQTDELIEKSVPWMCLTCGRCDEACPNGVQILKLVRFMRKFVPKELVPPVPCVEACPVGINIPGFIRMIAKGEESEALELILQKTPMPGVLGRVCNKPCESRCRRTKIDNPISICNLKRYVSDCFSDSLEKAYKPGKETRKKVLVVGAGPAGLGASYYLRRKGHSVTLIEEREEAGGMMRYGIPDYRLPKSVLDVEINRIVNMGVDLRTRTKLEDLTANKLIKGDFDAVFIAIGLQLSCAMSLNENTFENVSYGLDFLMNACCQPNVTVGNNVMVIGGGNVAIDVAMSAIRLGAKSVTLVSLESKDDMPADQSEVGLAIADGVKLINSWGVKQFLGNGRLTDVELVFCKYVFDKNGKFNPQFGEKTMKLSVDQVVIAIGQTYNKDFVKKLSLLLGGDAGVESCFLAVDSKGRFAKSENIFAGGDLVGATQSVAGALLSGRNIAISIDRLLGGDGEFNLNGESVNIDSISHKNYDVNSSYIDRQISDKLDRIKRTGSFSEINCGLTQKQVYLEASRCLGCDIEYGVACP